MYQVHMDMLMSERGYHPDIMYISDVENMCKWAKNSRWGGWDFHWAEMCLLWEIGWLSVCEAVRLVAGSSSRLLPFQTSDQEFLVRHLHMDSGQSILVCAVYTLLEFAQFCWSKIQRENSLFVTYTWTQFLPVQNITLYWNLLNFAQVKFTGIPFSSLSHGLQSILLCAVYTLLEFAQFRSSEIHRLSACIYAA